MSKKSRIQVLLLFRKKTGFAFFIKTFLAHQFYNQALRIEHHSILNTIRKNFPHSISTSFARWPNLIFLSKRDKSSRSRTLYLENVIDFWLKTLQCFNILSSCTTLKHGAWNRSHNYIFTNSVYTNQLWKLALQDLNKKCYTTNNLSTLNTHQSMYRFRTITNQFHI